VPVSSFGALNNIEVMAGLGHQTDIGFMPVKGQNLQSRRVHPSHSLRNKSVARVELPESQSANGMPQEVLSLNELISMKNLG
jgi:hypothetical protein